MLDIPCTNTLQQVSPVNYRIPTDSINTRAWMTRQLISEDSFEAP